MIHRNFTSGRGRARCWAAVRVAGKTLLVVLAALLMLYLSSLMDDSPEVGFAAIMDGRLMPWLNALPAMLLVLALAALTGRLLLSLGLSAGVVVLVHAVSSIKEQALAAPLVRADFRLVGQVFGDSDVFVHYIPHPLKTALLVLAVVIVCLILLRYEPVLWRRRWRWPCAVLVLGLLGSLLAGATPWLALYEQSGTRYKPWSTAKVSAERFGLVGNILQQGLHSRSHPALVRDPAPGRALLARHRQAIAHHLHAATGQAVLPDIVVLQSESFFDPADLHGYEADDWIPYFRRLQQQGMHGRLRVPTYGGKTIRTEFEVLTGLSLRWFPSLTFPYVGLHLGKVPGLVLALEQAGYRTLAIHPNAAGFWNRAATFRHMGFDRFISKEDPPFQHVPRCGFYICDKTLSDVILDNLPTQGPPQFIFAISMQLHGPYDTLELPRRARARDAIPVPPGVDGEAARTLRNYLVQQRAVDADLGRLAKALAARDRPALLLFYGDHLPGLGASFAAGFKNGLAPDEQTVPWLLIEPGQSQPRPSQTLPSWMLPATLLARVGVHDDPWFALQSLLAPQLRDTDWQPDDKLQRQLASLANLRLHGKLTTADTESLAAAAQTGNRDNE